MIYCRRIALAQAWMTSMRVASGGAPPQEIEGVLLWLRGWICQHRGCGLEAS